MNITTELQAALDAIVVPEFSPSFYRVQGDASVAKSDMGRLFKVTGPKADAVRKLAIHGGFTRKQIAELAECSVSRVAEVLWGLDYDGVEYDVAKKAAPVAV